MVLYCAHCPYLSNSSASSHVAEKVCNNVFTQQDRQKLLRPLSPATEPHLNDLIIKTEHRKKPLNVSYQRRLPSKKPSRALETSEQLCPQHPKVWS